MRDLGPHFLKYRLPWVGRLFSCLRNLDVDILISHKAEMKADSLGLIFSVLIHLIYRAP